MPAPPLAAGAGDERSGSSAGLPCLGGKELLSLPLPLLLFEACFTVSSPPLPRGGNSCK